MMMEVLKNGLNDGREPGLFFWRDNKGVEVDLIVDQGGTHLPVEIKAAQTWTDELAANLRRYMAWSGMPPGVVLYDGDLEFTGSDGIRVRNWRTFLLERAASS